MAKAQYPSDKQDQFMLRLPDGMRDGLKKAAEENRRSMNAEIVARLEESFSPSHENAEPERTKALIAALLREIDHAKSPDHPRHYLDRLSFPQPEVAARLYLAGAPLAEIDTASNHVRALETIDGLGAQDAERFGGRRNQLETTLEALLRPIVAFLRRAGWTVSPPGPEPERGGE